MVDLTGYRGVTKFRIQGKAVMFGSLAAQSSATPCNPMDCSPPESSVHEIFQQEFWNGYPFSSLRELPDPGIEPGFPALKADSVLTEPSEIPY